MRKVTKMEKGKFYLRQLYSTDYLCFDSKEELDKYKKWLGESDMDSDYDELIDTNDLETCKKYSTIIFD